MTDPQSAMGLIYTTWPDKASVEAAARALLDERLIACANILGPSTSIYRWQGRIETSREVVALFKTSAGKCDTVRARLMELHPYDEPAILNLSVSHMGSSAPFLDWVNAQL